MKKIFITVVMFVALLVPVGLASPAVAAPTCTFGYVKSSVFFDTPQGKNFTVGGKITYYDCYEAGVGSWYRPTTYEVFYNSSGLGLECRGGDHFDINIGAFGRDGVYNPPETTLACQSDGANSISHGFASNGLIFYGDGENARCWRTDAVVLTADNFRLGSDTTAQTCLQPL